MGQYLQTTPESCILYSRPWKCVIPSPVCTILEVLLGLWATPSPILGAPLYVWTLFAVQIQGSLLVHNVYHTLWDLGYSHHHQQYHWQAQIEQVAWNITNSTTHIGFCAQITEKRHGHVSQQIVSPCGCSENHHVDGLVQDCSNSSVLAMELLQSCTKPLMW